MIMHLSKSSENRNLEQNKGEVPILVEPISGPVITISEPVDKKEGLVRFPKKNTEQTLIIEQIYILKETMRDLEANYKLLSKEDLLRKQILVREKSEHETDEKGRLSVSADTGKLLPKSQTDIINHTPKVIKTGVDNTPLNVTQVTSSDVSSPSKTPTIEKKSNITRSK